MSRPSTKTTGKTFSPQVLQKLEDAFLLGLTNRQACFLASISESTFYAITSKNEQLLERFEALSESPKILAQKNIIKQIKKGDVTISKWYLEKTSFEMKPKPASGLDVVTIKQMEAMNN